MADVICPSCGGIYHETTEHFDPDFPAHGGMFRLKEKYRDWGWDSFPADAAIRFADLECPQCGGCYVDPGGRLVKDPVGEKNWLRPDDEEWRSDEDFVWGGKENDGWQEREDVVGTLDLSLDDIMPGDVGLNAGGVVESQTKERQGEQQAQGKEPKKTGTAQKKGKKKGKK